MIEKILERLKEEREIAEKELEKCIFKGLPYHDSTEGKIIGIKEAIEIVREVAEEYNVGWIPCSERLPEEPERTDDEEESIRLERLNEYNVMIIGAEIPTTLYYAGDGYWYDAVSQDYYQVTVWQPLPEPYKPKGE